MVCSDDKTLNTDAIKVEIPKDFFELGSHHVVYSDLDVSKHVNNSKYIQWVLDLLPEKYNGIEFSEINMNYLSECFLKDEIQVSYNELDAKLVCVGIRSQDKKNVFAAEFLPIGNM